MNLFFKMTTNIWKQNRQIIVMWCDQDAEIKQEIRYTVEGTPATLMALCQCQKVY